MRSGLVGHTGFVGKLLAEAKTFDAYYSSSNIADIAGHHFGTLVCAAAPATMWEANQNPQADAANIDRLVRALRSADVERLVLISTIAVLDDPSAGYDETTARYETTRAYGRNRRHLEEMLSEHFAGIHILRLPALFGKGLKKNFVFDLINPVPSFIRREKMEETIGRFAAANKELLAQFYAWDERLGMWALDRTGLNASPVRPSLTEAFAGIGFVARNFTNSRSCFQFYNVHRLAEDIDRVIESGIRTVNLCTEPMQATTICEALTGKGYDNDIPPLVLEDMRSSHSAILGGPDPYLFSRNAVLDELKSFYVAQVGQ